MTESNPTAGAGPLSGLRVIEFSLLGPAAVGVHLADLGAEVIKVESPQGDYVRQMTWPIIDGSSLLHWHINRGKKSITLDLRTDEAKDVFRDLVRDADVVIEAMRPGALAKRGLGFDDLVQINPKIVFCTISGYGMTGPYANLPSHGIAYDTWAGLVNVPSYDEDGFPYIPEHPSTGIHAGPLFGAFGILAGVVRARETGQGSLPGDRPVRCCGLDGLVPQRDLEGLRAARVRGDRQQGRQLRASRPRHRGHARRCALPDLRLAPTVTCCSWPPSRSSGRTSATVSVVPTCSRSGRGPSSAITRRATPRCATSWCKIFRTKTTAEWVAWSGEHNTTIAPVNTPKTLADDAQFQDRLGFMDHETHGADMLPYPVKFVGEDQVDPTPAPTVGEHTDEVLTEVLGYDADRIAVLRAANTFGTPAGE